MLSNAVLNITEAPLGRRHKVEDRGYDHVRLRRHVVGSDEAWKAFLASWDDLVPDAYVKASHPGRLRRYARFAYDLAGDTVEALPHRPFFQSLELNAYAGGIQRDFAPILDSTIANSVFKATLRTGLAAFVGFDDTSTWELGAHQIRTIGRADRPGEPTPEGVHSDGFEYVAMHLVNRHNVDGGETILRVNEQETRMTLLEPLETLFVDDRRCLHGATEIRPVDRTQPAARDTLIVTFHRLR